MMGGIEQQLRQEGFYVSTTSGWSMWPMLRDRRDRVVLRPLDGAPLRRGDLPMYRLPDGRYVLHRVIGVRRDGSYVIRGDNTYVKEYVPQEWILGVMTEFYRKDRHVMSDSRTYRCYAALWQGIYPIRYVCHYGRRLASRIKRKLFGKKHHS